jgi:hypothetical protein
VRRRPVGAFVFAGLWCPVLFVIQSQLTVAPPYVDPKPKPYSTKFFKFVMIGYWPAAVDWFWIQTLQSIGTKNHPIELKPAVFGFYELATDLDPRFYDLYLQASTMFGFLYKSPDEAIHFLEKGIQNTNSNWTQPHLLYLILAYYYSYEKNDWAKAKEQYLKASELPSSPAYLQRMKVWLQEEGAEKKLGKRVLSLMIDQTKDERLIAEYQKKLDSL